jgi:hypothetical protein
LPDLLLVGVEGGDKGGEGDGTCSFRDEELVVCDRRGRLVVDDVRKILCRLVIGLALAEQERERGDVDDI